MGGGPNSGLVAVDCNGDPDDARSKDLGDEDGSLIVGLAETLSGRPPFFTLRARCPAQAYCLPADDVRRIFVEARPHDGAAGAGGGLSMRLVAQATAVYLHRKTLYLTTQWERVVHGAATAAASTASSAAVIAAAEASKAGSAHARDGLRAPRRTRVTTAVARLFEDVAQSSGQAREEGGAAGADAAAAEGAGSLVDR